MRWTVTNQPINQATSRPIITIPTKTQLNNGIVTQRTCLKMINNINHHENKNTTAKNDQIILDKGDHVIGNHGYSTDIQFIVITVIRHDGPDIGY